MMLKTKRSLGPFSLSILVIIATSLVVGGLFKLGLWQLDRADEKVNLAALIHERQQQTLSINTSEITKQVAHMPASALGSYDSAHQFIYDNVTFQGVAGFEVLTPFKLKNNRNAILVKRGWKPIKDRRVLKQTVLDVPETERTIQGILAQPLERFQLDIVPLKGTFPMVIQSLDLKQLSKQLDYDLLPMVLELNKNEPDGFVREWRPFQGSADKHTAYAIQWFAFAGIFLIGVLFLHRKK